MKIIDVPQGSEAWLAARAGIPTACAFDRILTPAKLAPSESRHEYLAHLIAEWFLGVPIVEAGSKFMDRGTELEPEARDWYARQMFTPVDQVGFVTTDDGRAGCSPDGFVGTDGMVEIKCPSATEQMRWVIFPNHDKYVLQRQGQLWVTGRAWVDLCVYNPELPKVVRRHERDETIIAAIAKHVGAFCAELNNAKEYLADHKAERDAAIAARRLEEAADLPPEFV